MESICNIVNKSIACGYVMTLFSTDSKNDEERGGHQVGLALFLFTRVDCKLHSASLQPTMYLVAYELGLV